MAKRVAQPAGKIALDKAEGTLEGFAEDLGRLLGTAEAKARGWLGQRKQITKTLEGIRDTATNLLGELGHQAQVLVRRRGRRAGSGRRPGWPAGKRGPGRPRRRKLSAAARKAISDAQKARWAKVRAQKKK